MFKMADKKSLSLTVKKIGYIFYSILKSGKKPAYFVLWLKFLQVLHLPLDVVLFWIEKRKPNQQHLRYPLIIVVGIHRTGSTFVSQVLGEFLPFYTLGNYSSVFSKSSYYIHKWKRKTFLRWKKNRDGTHKSYYGISYGKYTIGDCYEVWDQWFGKDHYCFDKNILAGQETAMQQYFVNLEKAYKMPILTKNNRNYLAVTELKKNISQFVIYHHRKGAESNYKIDITSE